MSWIDQQLAVGMRSGAEAHDDGIFGALRNQFAEPGRDKFQQDRDCARLLRGPWRHPRSSSPVWRFCPAAESSQRGHDCGVRPRWPDDRDAGIDDRLDARDQTSTPPSSLIASQPASAMKRPALSTANSCRCLIGHVRHIADQQAVGRASAHGGCVADHVIHLHRQGGIEAEHGHAQAVADQDRSRCRPAPDRYAVG